METKFGASELCVGLGEFVEELGDVDGECRGNNEVVSGETVVSDGSLRMDEGRR